MKKILKEIFSFKTANGEMKDVNTFMISLANIGQDADTNIIGDDLVKATNLSKDQIAKLLNKIVIAYMRAKGYDYFLKAIQSFEKSGAVDKWEAFLTFFVEDLKKFIDKLPDSKEEDAYYSKYGSDAAYMKESDDKIWNNNMNPQEMQHWVQKYFKLPSLPTPDAAGKLVKLYRGVIAEGKDMLTVDNVEDILKSMGYEKSQSSPAPKPTTTPDSSKNKK
jgi:hypothetical protein